MSAFINSFHFPARGPPALPPRPHYLQRYTPMDGDTPSTSSKIQAKDQSAAHPTQCESSSAEQASNTPVSAQDSSTIHSNPNSNHSQLQETVALLQQTAYGDDRRGIDTTGNQTSLVRDRMAQFEPSQGSQSTACSRMSNSVCSFHTLRSTE